MATPLGVKTFTAGAVLLATEVNGYLMAQVIAVFATTTARDAAILAPEEGQFAYITADDVLTYYNGAVWLPFVSGGGLEPASPLLLMGA
jgi:hypothetical protein